MKSILWQLDKYKQDSEDAEPNINVEDNKPRSHVEFSIEELAATIGCDPNKLSGLPIYKYTQILYPLELLAIYYLNSIGCRVASAEKKCDTATITFVKMCDMNEYAPLFSRSVNDLTMKLMACRVAEATFSSNMENTDVIRVKSARGQPAQTIRSTIPHGKYDVLPGRFRSRALEIMGLSSGASRSQAARRFEVLSSRANLEELVISRIGYIITWEQLQVDSGGAFTKRISGSVQPVAFLPFHSK